LNIGSSGQVDYMEEENEQMGESMDIGRVFKKRPIKQ
jgi:hypothetical protein